MVKDNTTEENPQVKIPLVKFNLKSHKEDETKPILIFAMFRYKAKGETKSTLLRYTTAKHVLTKYWNPKTNRAKESVNYSDGAKINKVLNRIEETIKGTYETKFLGTDFTLEDFKKELDYRLGRKERPVIKDTNHKTFEEYFKYEIEKHKVRVEGKKGGQTWQKYETLLEKLKKYSKDTGFKLEYENFNETFLEDYVLLREKEKLSQNQISKEIETIKTILRRSKKYHKNYIYNDPAFKVDRITTSKHYPTLEELKKLFAKKFDNTETQEIVDLYLISAFGGGLRISDTLLLSEENEAIVDGESVIEVYTYKGRDVKADNQVVIPITPQLRQLIDKYNWKFPKYPEHVINDTLKDAFQLAGLKRKKLMKSGVKGEKPERVRLCDHVHFHTARNAYIDYMMNELDVPVEKLMKITGQSLKVLLAYERGDKKKNALKVSEAINKHPKLAGLTVVKSEAV